MEHVRRPTLDEAATLVAQLESCEAGLGRTVMGPTTPKRQRAAPQAVLALGTHRRGGYDRGPGTAALGPGSAGLAGGACAQRSADGKARLQG